MRDFKKLDIWKNGIALVQKTYEIAISFRTGNATYNSERTKIN